MALSFRSRSIIHLLAAACLAATAAVVAVFERPVAAIAVAAVRAWRFVCDLVFKPLASMAQRWVNLPGPAVALIAARQFYQRQIKRERPLFAPQWRNCPST